MSWLEQVTRPNPHSSQKYTTIVLHRHDSDEPITHRLRGLWRDEALYEVLTALVQEYYDPQLDQACELVWQEGEEEWGEVVQLVFNVRPV